jgi:hypothetical protein
MRAQVVEGTERERAWTIVCDNYSGYATYQRRASGRQIPIIALASREATPPATTP